MGRDPLNGRYRYVSQESVAGTRKEAEAALSALMAEVGAGGAATQADATVGQLIEQWLDLRRDTLSVTT